MRSTAAQVAARGERGSQKHRREEGEQMKLRKSLLVVAVAFLVLSGVATAWITRFQVLSTTAI